jgi:hypothetical protein
MEYFYFIWHKNKIEETNRKIQVRWGGCSCFNMVDKTVNYTDPLHGWRNYLNPSFFE